MPGIFSEQKSSSMNFLICYQDKIFIYKNNTNIMYECPLFPQAHNLDEDLSQHHDEDELIYLLFIQVQRISRSQLISSVFLRN
jgi:hypothetical protein